MHAICMFIENPLCLSNSISNNFFWFIFFRWFYFVEICGKSDGFSMPLLNECHFKTLCQDKKVFCFFLSSHKSLLWETKKNISQIITTENPYFIPLSMCSCIRERPKRDLMWWDHHKKSLRLLKMNHSGVLSFSFDFIHI